MSQAQLQISEEDLLTEESLRIIVDSLYQKILSLTQEQQLLTVVSGSARPSIWKKSKEVWSNLRDIIDLHAIMTKRLEGMEGKQVVVESPRAPAIIDLSMENISIKEILASKTRVIEEVVRETFAVEEFEDYSHLKTGQLLQYVGEPCILKPDRIYTINTVSNRDHGTFVFLTCPNSELADWQRGYYDIKDFKLYHPKEGDIVKYIGTDKALGDALDKEFKIMKRQVWGAGQPYFVIDNNGSWLTYPAIEFQFVRTKEQEPIILPGPVAEDIADPEDFIINFTKKDTWLARYIGPHIAGGAAMATGTTWCTVTKGSSPDMARVIGGGEGEYPLTDFEVLTPKSLARV